MSAIAEILVRDGVCTRDQIEEVLRGRGAEAPGGLPEALAAGGVLDEERYVSALSAALRLDPAPPLDRAPVPEELVARIPIGFARRHLLLPIGRAGGRVIVAMADPLDTAAIDDAGLLLESPVEVVVAGPSALRSAINRFYYEAAGLSPEESGPEFPEEGSASVETEADLLGRSDEGPVVEVVDTMILRAVRSRASDIHIEPYERELRVRFRVDGVLQEQNAPPRSMYPGIVSRIKIMADLDIAEQRLPQDGKARIRIGDREIDIRVSTVPTTFGERVVLRLLDPASMLYSLEALGMPEGIFRTIDRLLRMPHGLLLVTGPTGSGKTTTLYSAIRHIHDRRRNIITIEEPVEYQIGGIGQIEVKPQIGLTFAQGLRHVLRQDPDVILIGEMRDLETAAIAVRASLTGHQVLSTLHTNDAVSAITRLIDMGVESFLLSACLLAVLAQRLVRRICPECAEEVPVDPDLARAIGLTAEESAGLRPRRGRGCDRCGGTGYLGRIGLFELISFDRDVRRMVHDGEGEAALRELMSRRGMGTLRDDGLEKVRAGLTTLSEVVRVTMRDQD